jgi:manganese-dependent inorganic pyrophosphatase
LSHIYVTGHRNPDADSVAAAIGYAELKAQVDGDNVYEAVRLGEPNAQTAWLIERSGAELPELLPHILLRVRDVMREEFPTACDDVPVRQVGLTMAREGLDLLPIVNRKGCLVGVMTERALARRYVRESREASRLDADTTVGAIATVLEGELGTRGPGACGCRRWTWALPREWTPGTSSWWGTGQTCSGGLSTTAPRCS